MIRSLILLSLSIILQTNLSAETWRIECEDSPDYGKWVLAHDKNAGQGQLLMASDKTDNNLELCFELQKETECYVWVRTVSFGEGYRKIKLEINDVPCTDSFGDEKLPDGVKNAFLFSRSTETFKFPKGKNRIKITPLSPYSRCDLLILSDDKNFTPPEQREEIEKIQKINILNSTSVVQKTKDANQLSVLLFHGGRPWTADETAAMIRKAGLQVRLIDSAGLDGLGGAPLRFHLTDKTEPKPKDNITPEFEKLGNYNAVIVCCMETDAQKKFFTPERRSRLKDFINNGGTLITAENVPAEIEELLPVKFSNAMLSIQPENMECTTESPFFKNLPAKWPCFSIKNRNMQLKDNAEILVSQADKSGKNKMPYIASLNIGKGKAIYWNSEWNFMSSCVRLKDWAYFNSILSGLVYYGSHKNPPDLVSDLRFKQPDIVKIESENIKIVPPVFSENNKINIKDVLETDKNISITFDNSAAVNFDKTTCSYSLSFPGISTPVYKNVPMPEIITVLDDVHKKLEMATFEAVVDGKIVNKIINLKCDFAGIKKDETNGIVEIKVTNQKGFAGSLQFKAGKLDINGRSYNGVATGFSVEKMGHGFEAVKFTSSVALGESANDNYAWRMACYASPRGFAEVRFGKDLKASTGTWQHFGTGQPFNWLFSKQGVLCEFLDSPFAVSSTISSDKGPFATISNEFAIGLVSAVNLPFTWHYFSAGEVSAPNDWMAVYQFLRKRYCQQADIKQPVLYPKSLHTNTCTKSEKIKSFDTAKKLEFRIHKLPLCPSTIESLTAKALAEDFEAINSRGLQSKPWTAGGYTQGMDNEIAAKHPEWLAYDHAGDVIQYFGTHPVFDMNNPEYMAHYISVLDKAVANGMRHIYLDMGGAQTSVINYKGKDKTTQIKSAIKLFKHLTDKGTSVSIEGMSPLCIDEFWFRKVNYVNHTGKEFAFVGMGPGAWKLPDHLAMDYFRLTMNYCFMDVIVAPYACGLETVPGENALMEEIGKLNPAINEAIDTLGIPFVQQTPFGTVWTSEKGAALFFWNSVDKLSLKMPEGWKINKIFTPDGSKLKTDSNKIYGIPHKSIILITPR